MKRFWPNSGYFMILIVFTFQAGKPSHPPAQHKPLVLPKPSPAMPMTKAMAAIGAAKP